MPGGKFAIQRPPSLETENVAPKARTNRNEEKPARNQPSFETERQRVCGMPGVAGRLVASSAPVCGVRAHRLLRQFPEPACIQARGGDWTSHHRQLRAWRGLVLQLPDAPDVRGCYVASAQRASGESARSWPGRKGASRLGIAPQLTAAVLNRSTGR